MEALLLAVDSDDENYERQRLVWGKYGVALVRVFTMQEAIARMNDYPYIIVGVNADCIDYKAQLRILCEYAPAPVHVITSRLSDEESLFVFSQGADMYSAWCENPQINVERGLLFAENYRKREGKPKAPPKYISFLNLRLYLKCRTVVVGDAQVDLTQQEYGILYYLMQNRDCNVTHSRLFRYAWKENYDESCISRIRMQVSRLRAKLLAMPGCLDCIVTVKDTGYRFSTRLDK